MILLIDHRDSFTWNLAHLLDGLTGEEPDPGPVRVVQHDALDSVDWSEVRALVFSPGPGCPADYPETVRCYLQQRGRLPILGVCLGFQLILHAEGAAVVGQRRILHGVQTPISYNSLARAYRGVEPMAGAVAVGRYHSLGVDPSTIPAEFVVTATDPVDGTPLSFEHVSLPIYGLQYHPESFLSTHGLRIVRNCLLPEC